MKTNKSFLKRLKVSKNGKITARVPGHNHFNAKRSGNEKRQRNRKVALTFSMTAADKSRFLNGIK